MARTRAAQVPDAPSAGGDDNVTQERPRDKVETTGNTVRQRHSRTAPSRKAASSSADKEAKRSRSTETKLRSTDATLRERAEAEIDKTLQSIEDSLATLPTATYISGGSGSTEEDGRAAGAPCSRAIHETTDEEHPAGQPATRYERVVKYVVLVFLFGMLLLTLLHLLLPNTGPTRHPCLCALEHAEQTGAARLQPLVNTLLSRPQGISGIHVRDEAALQAVLRDLAGCPIPIVHVRSTIRDVAQLHDTLSRVVHPGRGAVPQCVIWVAPLASVRGVANVLKELLEHNQLLSQPVLPGGSRGLLIVVADMSRDELKERIPHRVVHMLRSIDW